MSKDTQTIYARVSIETKSALDAYAENNGMSMAGAVDRLIQDGLKYSAQDDAFLNIMSSALTFMVQGGE